MTPAVRPRILIVEDNFLVNRTIAEACQDWGYAAFGVVDAIAAADLLDAGPFDLLVVDYGLPGGISGEGVLRHYRSCNPGGAVVVISGMTLPSEPPAQPIRFLRKPFAMDQLRAVLAALEHARILPEVT